MISRGDWFIFFLIIKIKTVRVGTKWEWEKKEQEKIG